MRFVFKLLCKHHICLLFLQKGFCMKCSIIFNVLPKSFKEVDTVILNITKLKKVNLGELGQVKSHLAFCLPQIYQLKKVILIFDFYCQKQEEKLTSAWLHLAQPGLTRLSTAIGSILALKFKRSPFCSNTFEFFRFIRGYFRCNLDRMGRHFAEETK